MEKKTKQRILGALIVVGFIVIMLPFFQSTKDIPGEPTTVKAPPFPDQAVQVSETPAAGENVQEGQVNPQVNDMMGVKQPSTTNPEPAKPASHANSNTNSDDNDKSDAQPLPPPPTELTTSDDNKSLSDASKTEEVKDTKTDAASKKREKISLKQNAKTITTASSHKIIHDENGLAKIQEAVWVIQIGSFKNKANALRLVNQLRASGYKAFIQQVSTSLGSSTRVFVGPEPKHASARAIVKKLKAELKINGIVISYKPLTL